MTENTEHNFYRLIAFLVDVAPNIVRKYFKRNILKGERFADYLDRNKHVLFHIWRRIKCCQCTQNQLSRNTCMSDKQFYLLFDNKKEKNRLHKDECICKFEAKQNIELAVLDISLAFNVLVNCEKLDYSVQQWLEQIKKIRNKVVHQSDVQSITSQDFQSIWKNLESVLTGLALKVDSNCATEMQSQISELRGKILIHEDKLKIKKLLEEWITERYVDIEEIQQKCFQDMRRCHDQAEVNAGKRHEEGMNQTSTILTKIDILTDIVVDAIDMTVRGNIAFEKLLEPSNDPDESSQKACKEAGKQTVPILMHLDIPADWDKFKVIKAIKNLQNMLSSMESNFTIQSYSTEVLDLFLDIKRRLLNTPVEFRKEFKIFMTDLCKEAEVDVSKAASIHVTAEYLPEKEETDIPRVITTSCLKSNEEKMELKEKKPDTTLRKKDSDIQQIVNDELQRFSGLHRIMMTKKEKTREVFAVVAINIGTPQVAWSFRSEYKCHPNTLCIEKAWDTSQYFCKSRSSPSAILLDSSQQIVALGYEAQEKYTDLVEEAEHYNWYYFSGFTNQLRDRKAVTTDTMIKDQEGREFPLQTVFSMVIQYLAKCFLERLKRRGGMMRKDEIQWVLTLPIYVPDNQTQFFVEAAVKAGLRRDQLSVCLEPAAAYLYFKYDQQQKYGERNEFEKLFKFILIDLRDMHDTGVDITCMERKADGILEELLSVSVDSAGYTSVRDAFYRFLIGIVGEKVFQDFQEENKIEAFDLQMQFYRRLNDNPGSSEITINVPILLRKMWESTFNQSLSDVIKTKYNQRVSWVADKLRIDSNLFFAFFDDSKSRIIKFMEKLLCSKTMSDVTTILVIGSFAKCVPIQQAIMEAFPTKQVIIPEDLHLAVYSGAVMFGHEGY